MYPFYTLLVAFLAVPLLEIYLLIKVGKVIGALPTVGLVVLTAVMGAFLIRAQGLSTYRRLQTALAQGEVPAVEMLEGVVLLVSGALLLTPGFFTDTLGFLALVPPLRRRILRRIVQRAFVGPEARDGTRGPEGPRTLEGEYRREDE